MKNRLSLNEITSTSSKALQTIGMPPGLDVENARNVAWLEAHSLRGLNILYKEIIAFKSKPKRLPLCIKNESEMIRICGQNQSGFSIAQTAIDIAETRKIVKIDNCRAALIIFAEMARRTHLRFGLCIKWSCDQEKNRGVCIAGKSAITIKSSNPNAMSNIIISGVDRLRIKNPDEMFSRYNQAISNGITYNNSEWDLIMETAKKTLVPNSELSRGGAGAEVDDNN
tara:strand:- start:9 stop:686 length:678 start_codon:yes stop_codon:yes gene_type:complete